MHFVSGHKRPAGRGSVLDGAVERGGCKNENPITEIVRINNKRWEIDRL